MQKRLEWLNNFGYIEKGSIIRTRTTSFLMPLIGISEAKIIEYHPKIFINTYIKDVISKQIVIILNKLDFAEESITFVLLQNLNENFIEYIEDDEEYLLYYKIPNHFHEDFEKIIDGKYSKTSDSYKSVILNIYGIERNIKDHRPYMHDCLYPDNIKRKLYANYLNVDVNLIDEVSSKPCLKEYELFRTINDLKKDYGAQ